MSRLKRLLVAALATATLQACSPPPPYASPTSGPTATVNIDMFNAQGSAGLSSVDVDAGFWMPMHDILDLPKPGESKLTITVPAEKKFYLSFGNERNGEHCLSQFSFFPTTDATYFLHVGDTPPTVSGFWQTLAEGPEHGAACYVQVAQQRPGGTSQPIQLTPWKFFKIGPGSTPSAVNR